MARRCFGPSSRWRLSRPMPALGSPEAARSCGASPRPPPLTNTALSPWRCLSMTSPRLPADTGVVRTSRGAAFLVPHTDQMPHPQEPPGPTPPSRSERLPATRLRPSRRGRVGRTIYFPADLIRVVDDQWREVAAEIPGGAGKTAFYIACIIAGLEDA